MKRAILSAILLFITTTAISADSLGKWLRKEGTIEIVYEIILEGDGAYLLNSDGSQMELTVVDPKTGEQDRFLITNYKFGDGFAILANGSLKFFDAEGEFANAQPL